MNLPRVLPVLRGVTTRCRNTASQAGPPAAAMTNGVLIRPAEARDRDAVMAILPNRRNGSDYMISLYDNYMDNPHSHPFVAEIDNHIVGFVNTYIVDGGQTVITTGGRIQPRYAGRGIVASMKRGSLASAMRRFPQLQLEKFAAVDTPFYDRYKDGGAEWPRISSRQAFLWYVTDAANVAKCIDSIDPDPNARHITEEEIERIFSNKATLSKLFPEPAFVIYPQWFPVHVTRENLAIAARTTNVIISADDTDAYAVSFRSVVNVKIGVLITVFVYTSSALQVTQHLRAQLVSYTESIQTQDFQSRPNKISIEVHFSEFINRRHVKEILEPHFGPNVINDQVPSETVLIVEYPVELKLAKSNI